MKLPKTHEGGIMIVVGVLFAVRMGTCAAAGLVAMYGGWWWALALTELSFGLDLLALHILDKRQDAVELLLDDDMGRIIGSSSSYAGILAIFLGMGLFPHLGLGAWITLMLMMALAIIDLFFLMPWSGRTMPIVTLPRVTMAFLTVCMGICLWRVLHGHHIVLFVMAMLAVIVQNLRIAKRQQEARLAA
jgi:hypothetical protein